MGEQVRPSGTALVDAVQERIDWLEAEVERIMGAMFAGIAVMSWTAFRLAAQNMGLDADGEAARILFGDDDEKAEG